MLTAAAPVAAQAAPGSDHVDVPGLDRPVEILVDRWGIAHIYAETEHDLFFAQGWNAARDRLFQLELWRRQATGTVAEILGPRELERDIGTRLFRFRRDLEQELRHYHPRGVEIIEAYVAGINAYIAAANRDPERLPLEFRLLGIQPQAWTPEVVISRHQGLLGNINAELRYGRAVARLGPERVRALTDFGPGDPELALDPGIDAEALSETFWASIGHSAPACASSPKTSWPSGGAHPARSPRSNGPPPKPPRRPRGTTGRTSGRTTGS